MITVLSGRTPATASQPRRAAAHRRDVPMPWAHSAWVQLLPVAAFLVTVALRFVWDNLYHFGTKEDGLAEWLTAAVYLGVAVGALLVARAAWPNRVVTAAHLLLLVGAVFIAGEEISWGQRVLGFAGPDELVERNLQSEANLHNLLAGHALHSVYILVGLAGAFGARWLVPRISWLRPGFAFAPPRWLRWWFGVPTAFYLFVELINPLLNAFGLATLESLDLGRLQEVVELFLACGFLLFVFNTLGLMTRGDDGASD